MNEHDKPLEPISEDPWFLEDSDGDGLINREEEIFGTDPYSRDADRDGISDFQEVTLGINPTSSDTNQDLAKDESEELPQQIEDKDPSVSDPNLVLNQNTSIANGNQSSFIDVLYRNFWEHSNLELSNTVLSVRQGADLLYEGNFQSANNNILTLEQEDLLQKALDNPRGLQGELKISVNNQLIFFIDNGDLVIDQYGIADNQQVAEVQPQNQNQAQAVSYQPSFDSAAIYNRYQQEVQSQTQAPVEAPALNYERIAQKTLDNNLSQEQAKQVLQHAPFYQTLSLGIGQQEAQRYTDYLLKSLTPQPTNGNSHITALESRVQNLETFNQHISSQLEILNQKLDRLSQSKAFESQSPGLNQFLKNVSQSIANTWQSAKDALRQKAGEVSLSLLDATAKKTTQWFGEEAKDGSRVIDANGQRLAIAREGSVSVTKAPVLQAQAEYQRLSQKVGHNLPPSLQAKQIAQAALKERFTTTQVQLILSQAPKFKEILSSQGADTANQFASVAIAAATRQNLIDGHPRQRESQQQKQIQA